MSSRVGNCCYPCFSAKSIQVDTDGEISSTSRGYPPGKGIGAGIEATGLPTNAMGGSGGSHGGLGGRGSEDNYASSAYDSVRIPHDFGSGGNTLSHYNAAFNTKVRINTDNVMFTLNVLSDYDKTLIV